MKSLFLTNQEMSAVYEQREHDGLSNELYTLNLNSASSRFIFCGSRHTNIPEDKQFGEIEALWAEFTSLPGNKVAFCEGRVRPIDGKSREQAIITGGDPGLICYLAKRDGIELISPEPDMNLEVRKLVAAFGPEKTALYYFDRQMYQWARADFRHRGNVQEYILGFIKQFPTAELQGLKLTPNVLYNIFQKETGKAFSFIEIQTIHNLLAPNSNEVASMSSLHRNESIFDTVKSYKGNGYNIFIVYGSGHAIVLEPALRELYAK